MAAIASKNGLIILAPGDTHVAEASALIEAIIINDTAGSTAATLSNTEGDVLFVSSQAAIGTQWYGICGCLTTAGGLSFSGSNAIAYIYIK